MVLVAILLGVLAVGLLTGLAGARLWALLAGAWLAALALALVLPRAVSLRLLGWDWRLMLIATGLGLLVAAYIGMIRRLRRLSGIGQLRAEAEAARAEGAALQAGLDATRAQARAEAARGQLAAARAGQAAEAPPARSVAAACADAGRASAAAGEEGAAPPLLVCGPRQVTAPLCLALAAAGAGRITLAGKGAEAAAAAVASLYPACQITAAALPPPVAGFALVLGAGGEVAALNRDCVAAGVPLLHGWLEGGAAQVALWHPAAGAPCLACHHPQPPHTVAGAGAAPGLPALLGALMAAQLRQPPPAAVTTTATTVTTADPRAGRVLAWDAGAASLDGRFLRPDPDCAVCAPARHAAGIAEQKPGSGH